MKQYLKVRSFLAHNVSRILDHLVTRRQDRKIDADDLFAMDSTPVDHHVSWDYEYALLPKKEVLLAEKDSLGLYISGNPLEDYVHIEKWAQDVVRDDRIQLILINKIRKIFTKSNKMMFALLVSTTEGDYEAIIFPKHAMELSPKLQDKSMFWVSGKMSKKKKEVQPVSDLNPTPSLQSQSTQGEEELTDIDSDSPVVQTHEQEPREYDEEPKLLIEWLNPFEEGIDSLVSKLDLHLSKNRLQQLEGISWQHLFHEPWSLQSLIDAKEIRKESHSTQLHYDSHNAEHSMGSATTILRLSSHLGVEAMKHIKLHLFSQPTPETIPVEIWIEQSGQYRKVKGIHYTTSAIITQYSSSV